jgi:hypothetical protein
MGIGARLVQECVEFAERAGFTLAEEQEHRSFGRDLVAQTWSRALSPPTRT